MHADITANNIELGRAEHADLHGQTLGMYQTQARGIVRRPAAGRALPANFCSLTTRYGKNKRNTMEIRIPLNLGTKATTYKELKSQLKQLELSVHHAQKAIENAEKDGVGITEDCFICFEHPYLDSDLKLEALNKKTDPSVTDYVNSFIDNHFEELNLIELRINLD